MTACLDLLECAGDALPYTVVVPDDHPFVGHEAKRGVGVRDHIVIRVRSVHKNEAGAASMGRPVESRGVPVKLRDTGCCRCVFRTRIGEMATGARLVDVGALARREIEFRGSVRRQIQCENAYLRRCVDREVERGAPIERADFDVSSPPPTITAAADARTASSARLTSPDRFWGSMIDTGLRGSRFCQGTTGSCVVWPRETPRNGGRMRGNPGRAWIAADKSTGPRRH